MIDLPTVETGWLGDALARMTFERATDIELALVPGGGATLSATLPDGQRITIDLFPTIADASPGQHHLLDLLGADLSIRLELAEVHTPARRLDDLTDLPLPALLPPFEVSS